MSDHLIFPAVSVHMQGSYIISAWTLCSQNSKRLYLLSVDPLGLISGTCHKLLWGNGQGRWLEKGEPYSGSLLDYCKSSADCQSDQDENNLLLKHFTFHV